MDATARPLAIAAPLPAPRKPDRAPRSAVMRYVSTVFLATTSAGMLVMLAAKVAGGLTVLLFGLALLGSIAALTLAARWGSWRAGWGMIALQALNLVGASWEHMLPSAITAGVWLALWTWAVIAERSARRAPAVDPSLFD
ncbi:MAG: hypothetical protein KC613_15600 [Myxococcales bacterium]|nr:hypothetical protein [Myxococcales bacterium]